MAKSLKSIKVGGISAFYTRTSDGTNEERVICHSRDSNTNDIVATSHYIGDTVKDYLYYDDTGILTEVSLTSEGNPLFKFFSSNDGVQVLLMMRTLNNKPDVHLAQRISPAVDE